MSHLDVMLSMDSASMHLASLVDIPLSPFGGQPIHTPDSWAGSSCLPHAVQVDLPCRPCSVFGNKPCLRKDYACLQGITPEMVVQRIESVID